MLGSLRFPFLAACTSDVTGFLKGIHRRRPFTPILLALRFDVRTYILIGADCGKMRDVLQKRLLKRISPNQNIYIYLVKERASNVTRCQSGQIRLHFTFPPPLQNKATWEGCRSRRRRRLSWDGICLERGALEFVSPIRLDATRKEKKKKKLNSSQRSIRYCCLATSRQRSPANPVPNRLDSVLLFVSPEESNGRQQNSIDHLE